MYAASRLPSKTEMERARLSRDASYDGVFLVGVRTMRIFCRPSCPAKQPLPENVVYFASVRQAIEAGYRPCKRCRPERLNGHTPAWVRALLGMMRRYPDRPLRAVVPQQEQAAITPGQGPHARRPECLPQGHP